MDKARSDTKKDSNEPSDASNKPRHAAASDLPNPGGRSGAAESNDDFQVRNTPEEGKLYDFVGSRPSGKKTTLLESIGHLVKGCLGGGLVAVHENYKHCGLWSAVILNIVLGFFLSYCIYILVESAQKMYGRFRIPVMSYPDVAEGACVMCPWKPVRKCRKVGRILVDVTVGLDLFGSCAVYMVIIGRTLKQLVVMTDHVGDEGIRYYIIGLLIPCILIAWILELKYLAPFSIIADFFIVCVVIATIVYGSQSAKHSPFDLSYFPFVNNAREIFTFMGAIVFSMEGVGVSMAIENHMQNPRKFPVVLTAAMSIVISMVTLVGFFGYWGFGHHAKSPVTLNFTWSWISIILKVFMALIIYVTFSLNFWVPFDLCWHYLKKYHPQKKYWFWNRFYRTIFVTVICVVALIFPNVAAFNGLLGAFCLSNMGFIYPALIEFVVNWDEFGVGKLYCRAIKCILIIIFGIVLCVIGTYTSLTALLRDVYGLS